MLTDKETDIDALGFEPYADSFFELITEKGITPFTIGIFGSWGTGKTSLMLMLKKKLESLNNVKTVWFNAWKFDDEKQIWTALIQAILSQLDLSLGENAKLKLQKLRDSIEWIQLFSFLGKSTISGVPDIDSLRQSFKFKEKIESILEFEKKFEELVETCKIERLVIFIDDLDRCRMDATLDILEAIKLLLNSKKCVYVLGLDYQRVCDAVCERFAKGSQRVAEDYFDKIVQLSFHIPRRTEQDMRLYLRYLFALKYVGKEDLRRFSRDIRTFGEFTDKEFLELLQQYVKDFSMNEYKAFTEHDLLVIRENEFNPRKLKRFLNTYEMRVLLSKVLDLNLENEYLIKFLLLQTRFSDFYRNLENYPSLLNEIEKLSSLPERERSERLEKSELLKKYYSDTKLLDFIEEVGFEYVDPSPYLRIAETAKLDVTLGEEEERILEDLASDDLLKTSHGLRNFQDLHTMQKKRIIRDLIEKMEHNDASVRTISLKIFGRLRDVMPKNLIEDVVRKLIERIDDENAEIRAQILWAFGELRDIILENIEENVIGKLIERIDDENAKVRAQALQTLRRWRFIDVIPEYMREDVAKKLIERIDDENAEVRVQALWTVGSLKYIPKSLEKAVVKKLIERTDDEDSKVRAEVLWALKALKPCFSEDLRVKLDIYLKKRNIKL